MILFTILRQPVTILVTVFSNLTKIDDLSKECLTTVKQVFFAFTNKGILSGYQSLLALHLSGTPSLMTGTSPLVYSSTTVCVCYEFRKNIFG